MAAEYSYGITSTGSKAIVLHLNQQKDLGFWIRSLLIAMHSHIPVSRLTQNGLFTGNGKKVKASVKQQSLSLC